MRRDVSSCQFICKVLFVFVFGFGFGFVYVKLVYSVRRLHALGVCLAPVHLYDTICICIFICICIRICICICDIGVFCEEAARAGGVSCASPFV